VSILTKVFVVLLTVCSIALSMLVVAAFAKQEHWREEANVQREAALAQQAKARTISANATIEQQRALTRHREDVARINELTDRRADDDAKITEVALLLAEAENRLTVEQGQVTSVSDQNKLLQAAFNRESEFGARLAKRNSELERQNIELTDRIKELTSEVAMAASQIRALKQQIVAMEDTGVQLAAGQISGIPAIVEEHLPTARMPAVAMLGSAIRGEVTDVIGNLASISVGSADGVTPGMIFLIYRRDTDAGKPRYLGSVRIGKVQAGQSAGLIEQSVGDIGPGDLVRDELSLAMRD
jgi:hypothetical protein